MLITESGFNTMSLDPSSLKFTFEQGTFSILIPGSPLLNGGPFQSENPSGPRTGGEEKRVRERNNIQLIIWENIASYLKSPKTVNGQWQP